MPEMFCDICKAERYKHNTLRNHSCFKKYIIERWHQEKGTSMMLEAQAVSTALPSSTTHTFSYNTLYAYGLVTKSIKLTSYKKLAINESIVRWLCQSMRPFLILNDIGLRNLSQQATCMDKT